MKKENRFVCRFARNPRAIEQLGAVPTLHRVLSRFHCFLPIPSPRDAVPLRLYRCRSYLLCATNNCEARQEGVELFLDAANAGPSATREKRPANNMAEPFRPARRRARRFPI